MLPSAVNENTKLNTIRMLMSIRDAVDANHVLRAMVTLSKKIWDESFDANTKIHLIKGVSVSPQKTDAVKIYITGITKIYLDSQGVMVGAWTKHSLCSENFVNVLISNKISAQVFKTHEELFSVVLTRLMGVDKDLTNFILAEGIQNETECLMIYLARRFNLEENESKILAHYPDTLALVKSLLELPRGEFLRYIHVTLEKIIDLLGNQETADDKPLFIGDVFDVLAQVSQPAVTE